MQDGATNDDSPQTVLCLKWGERYGSEYVNRLYSMTRRNTSRPLHVVCFTDNPEGICEEVDVKPMPEFDLPERMRFHPFRHMFIFEETLAEMLQQTQHSYLKLIEE